jgi:hypothetical protein
MVCCNFYRLLAAFVSIFIVLFIFLLHLHYLHLRSSAQQGFELPPFLHFVEYQLELICFD